MSFPPDFQEVYSHDKFNNIYDTALINTSMQSESKRGSGIKARGWSLATAIWSAAASPFKIVGHVLAAVFVPLLDLGKLNFRAAHDDFKHHSFKVLDTLGKMVSGTILGIGGVLMPSTASKVNISINGKLREIFGGDLRITVPYNLQEILKGSVNALYRDNPKIKPIDIYKNYIDENFNNKNGIHYPKIDLLKELVPETTIQAYIDEMPPIIANEIKDLKEQFRKDLETWLNKQLESNVNFKDEITTRKRIDLEKNKLFTQLFILFGTDKMNLTDQRAQKLAEAFSQDPSIVALLEAKLARLTPS